jgi:O-acetyl-ADP-ribose deacetylase (regulator of RNase III)
LYLSYSREILLPPTSQRKGAVMQRQFGNGTIEIVQGDITDLETDAIVNPANQHLQLGGGVAGAIKRKGGETIQEECDAIGKIDVGSATITGGGRLAARHVIHAVGPRMGEGGEDEKLRSATLSALRVAEENSLKSISFPAISTGIFGYPLEKCSEVMLRAAREFLEGESGIERVVFCLYDSLACDRFEKTLSHLPD